MTCQRILVRQMTLWQAKEDGGFQHGWSHEPFLKRVGDRLVKMTGAEVAAEEERIERETLCGEDVWVWMHGHGPPEPQCECGALPDLLCDYPMGRGKTCDIVMCEVCARKIGDDRHLCVIHFAEFQAKAKVDRINPWPPTRSTR